MAREMKDSGIKWIGEIPKNYSVYRLKHLIKKALDYGANSSGVEYSNHLPRYIRITDIAADGKLKNDGALSLELDDASPYILEDGDILFARSGATVGKSFIYHTEYGRAAFAGYLIRAQLKKEIVSEYVYYYTCSTGYDIWKNGIFIQSTIQNISADKYMNLPIVLPETKDEQMQIVNFLRNTCVELDNVLEKTRASIEEYKKLKQSVITQAVTQGIKGNREMKDSGIEWIGEIPVEWEERRIKTLFTLREEKNFLPLEEVNLISLYTDLGVVQHSELEKTTGNKASNADGYKMVYKDDIVVNIILCWMGAIGRSEYNGVTSPAYDIYIPQNEVLSQFYHYYFRTRGFGGDCYKRGKGIMAMRWRTYSDQFRDISVVYPPLKEQIEIINYLDAKCAEIDNLITKKEKYLAEIENYKKSLIYEYVTGKKEI